MKKENNTVNISQFIIEIEFETIAEKSDIKKIKNEIEVGLQTATSPTFPSKDKFLRNNARESINNLLPYNMFKIEENIFNFGDFTKNGRFVVKILNIFPSVYLSDLEKQKQIKILNYLFLYLIKNFGGRRIKTDNFYGDFFIFNKDYSNIIKRNKSKYEKRNTII